MATGKRRSQSQMARDRRKIANLYLEGWLQTDIADEIGLSQATISRDLSALHKEWLRSALVDFDKAKSKELAKVDKLEREYYQAWQRSCEDAETVVKKQKDGGGKEMQRTLKGQAGDPRFLAGVQWCIERRCKIMGIDAPKKVAPTDPSGKKEYQPFSLENLSDAELDRLGKLFAKVTQ